ncbi:hypothetical protein [Nocardia brasiliensis]|uniref:hypothetical protein n=1 Tax=Nocardia brasiliensis TaxID=37326 RepID=UPI0024585BAD|nr:hypothetical protein [Nocardia brasiliensis]
MPQHPQRIEQFRYRVGAVAISEVGWRHPAGQRGAPTAFDRLSYLRYRPLDADADLPAIVLSLQPGNTGGPSSFDPLARNLVAALRRRGVCCEVWAMTRRSQHLIDRTGMRAAVEAGDHQLAVDYYYRGHTVAGRTFGGWLPARRLAFLAGYGVEQVVADWQHVHALELPDPADRARRLFIGGHSLGGPLANLYCQWDFPDGPGYRQVAGVIGVDGPITADPLDLGDRLRPLAPVANRALPALTPFTRAGLLPATNHWGPLRLGDIATLIGVAALAARYAPGAESTLLREVPRTLLVDSLFRLLYPQGGPRRWRLTNAALFGTLFGRVAQATTLANDMGGYTGPPRVKRTPLTGLTRIPLAGELFAAALSDRPLSMPADPHRLTDWSAGDDAISSFDDTVFAWGNGEFSYLNPYESRLLPMQAVLGLLGGLAAGRHGDWSEHLPALTVAGDLWAPIRRRRGPRPGEVDAVGYSHQDVLSARQPDIVVDSMARFLLVNTPLRRTA